MRFVSILPMALCAAVVGNVHAAPITTGTPFQYRDHEGPNTVGTGVGDNLTIVVPNVAPNIGTSAFATNPQTSGSVSLQNAFTSPFGFFSRSFATDVSANAGSVTAATTVTLQNRADTLSLVSNATTGLGQLPLLSNLAASGSPLAPTLTWDPVTTGVFYNQVRLSIYNDRTDQVIISERSIGSPGLASYTVPVGTLAPNTDYAFRVFLWDGSGAGGVVVNRSSTHVNFTTTSAAVGVGGLQIATTDANGGNHAPLVLQPGVPNDYPGAQVNIGRNGPGAATLKSGTTLAASYLDVGNGVLGPNVIGTLVIDDTKVRLTGAGAPSWSSPGGGFLTAGRRFNGARGFVEVVNGGRVEIDGADPTGTEYVSPGIQAGRDANTFGNINVDGAGSTIVVNGPTVELALARQNGVINIGRSGDGRLNVIGGGQVLNAVAGATYIGRESGGRGSVLVSGGGSTLDAGRELHIGPRNGLDLPGSSGGEGVLRVENGARVFADSTTVGPGGLLTGNLGRVRGNVTLDGGVLAPGSSPGLLTIEGDVIVETGQLQLEAFAPGQIDALDVTGTIDIKSGATIEVQLGFTPSGPLAFLTAGGGIVTAPGFAGPQVVALLGTEAQGMAGSTVALVIGDQTYEVAVQVPPIDPAVDYDGDGVLDGADDCPGSSAAPTLSIGGCETGVTNAALGRGCKMSDAVRACERDARVHGAFVSCVAGNANRWLNDGLVSSHQRGNVQACAAKP